MAHPRDKLAAIFAALEGNAYWRQYVSTLQEARDDAVRKLLLSDHPDEAMRGEARAYEKLLYTIISNRTPTP